MHRSRFPILYVPRPDYEKARLQTLAHSSMHIYAPGPLPESLSLSPVATQPLKSLDLDIRACLPRHQQHGTFIIGLLYCISHSENCKSPRSARTRPEGRKIQLKFGSHVLEHVLLSSTSIVLTRHYAVFVSTDNGGRSRGGLHRIRLWQWHGSVQTNVWEEA